MAIRKRVEWDGKKFHGYVDFGVNLESDNLDEAKEALACCLEWILENSNPSHMIKLVRNAFGSKQVLNVRRVEKRKLIYGKPIKWDFVKKLSEIQETELRKQNT
ncbi:uncharacterized protein [Leptinotarsa decemlineata]|uniref:uncharacterized protein n=1 Tax=Leptinotarsa decemlineata TaxID=7539 RepID=UPI003D30C12F